MNYELCKKLKEAGFAQTYHWKSPGVLDHYTTEEYLNDPLRNDPVEIPTLSELIESCGDDFFMLERNRKGLWRCLSVVEKDGCFDVLSRGETPEIAVANLWLKLNGKS